MSKTPFKMPPRGASAATGVHQWVAGGGESTAQAEAVTGRPDRTATKMARLTIDLPAGLHAKFKSTCALKGTRMIDEVRQFIEGWTQKNG